MTCASYPNASVVGPKTPNEIKVITFDFVDQLGDLTGFTIVNVTITPVVIDGADPTPTSILIGPWLVDGIKVRQGLQGGLDLVTYAIRCLVTDSNGLRHEIVAVLRIEEKPAAWLAPA